MNGKVFGLSELGQALKEARMARGMTLDDIQDLTKIQKRYLLAIENGEYDKLPGNFYTRAFMKSYAEAVGMDPKQLFSEYAKDLPRLENGVDTVPSRTETHEVSAKSSKWVNAMPKILAVFVIVLILVGIWVFMQKITSNEDSQAGADSANHVAIKKGADLGNGKASKSSAKETSDQKQSKGDELAGQTSDKSDAEAAQQLKLEETSGHVSHYTLTGTTHFDLEITAKQGGNSWIQVSKDSPKGERLFYSMVSNGVNGTKDAKFHQDVSDVKTIYIKIGSAPNTRIQINGQDFTFPNDNTVQELYITFNKAS